MNDLISRQEAIDALAMTAREKFNLSDEYSHYLAGLMDGELAIKNLPSAEPEWKTGHWVYDENGMDWNLPAWVCSECHGRNGMIPTYIRGKDKMIKVEHPLRWAGSKYCPNCGARMQE